MLSCSAHIITRHVLHARDPMADRQAGSSSLIFTGGTVEVSMKCDLTKKRFCERLCVTPGTGYLHKIKTLPCSASNNHWLLFCPWRRIGFYLCLIFACFRPSDIEQSDVWELRIHPNETSWLIWMHWMQRIHSFYYLYKNIFYKKSRRNFKNIWRKKAEPEILKRI